MSPAERTRILSELANRREAFAHGNKDREQPAADKGRVKREREEAAEDEPAVNAPRGRQDSRSSSSSTVSATVAPAPTVVHVMPSIASMTSWVVAPGSGAASWGTGVDGNCELVTSKSDPSM